MNEDCGCCEGTGQLTPRSIANRPGLNLLTYRMGTHAAFLETMKARLSNYFFDIPRQGVDENGQPWAERIYPLADLTTRASEDPSIALLDAWATVGDVLTFYQERIANEGYLRTANERRSILELARLVGYTLRPGVASTVYLAYTLDSSFKEEVLIPAGARVQSLPEPNEQPQSFETSEPLHARAVWNKLKPRMTRPQTNRSILPTQEGSPSRVYLKGTATNLKPNDPLLIDFGAGDGAQFFRVHSVTPHPASDSTEVILQAPANGATAPAAAMGGSPPAQPTPLSEYVASFSAVGDADPTELPDLVRKFAVDLLTAFGVLVRAPASPERNGAIQDTLYDLRRLRDILISYLQEID